MTRTSERTHTDKGIIHRRHTGNLRVNWNLPRFALLLAIILTAWMWPSIIGGKVLLPLDLLSHAQPNADSQDVPSAHNTLVDDMLYENYIWKTLLRRCAAQGELPLWNPNAFCGHPLYATGQASTFYPFNLIFLLVPLSYAYVIYT